MLITQKPVDPINEETTILFQAISERSSYSLYSNQDLYFNAINLNKWLNFINFNIPHICLANWHYDARLFYEGMITYFDVSKFKNEAEKEEMIKQFVDFSDLTRRDLDDIFHIYKRKVLAIFFLQPFSCLCRNHLNKLIKDLYDPIHKYLIDLQTNIHGLWDRYKDKILPEFKESFSYKNAHSKNSIFIAIPDDPPIYFESHTEYNRVTDVQNSNSSLLPGESSEHIENYQSHDEITNRH